jgi:hypothetical protein
MKTNAFRAWTKSNESSARNQGDQIRRIFASWAIVHFGKVFFIITEKTMCLGYLLTRKKLCINVDVKCVGLHFGPILSKAHPVTLARTPEQERNTDTTSGGCLLYRILCFDGMVLDAFFSGDSLDAGK